MFLRNFFSQSAIIVSTLLPFVTFSQNNQAQSNSIDEIFKNKKEVYFSFYLKDKEQIHELTRIISIDNIKGDSIYAYANKLEFIKFTNLNYSFTLLPSPASHADIKMTSSIMPGSKQNWDYYPTYPAYVNLMKQFAIDYPGLCKLYCIDTLPSGRLLLAVKISDNVNTEEDEPEFLYTSSMHGDELTGYILTLHLIDYLLTNYGVLSEVTNLVNNLEIWINPLANPDGTYAGGNNTVSGATRYNDNGVDINRNFPDLAYGDHPDYLAWQPETEAFMAFAEGRNFVMSANLHGGAEVFNYPWDTWSNTHADDTWWNFVGREYADTTHKYAPSGYMDDLNNGVTNGYSWYQITGGRQDYMNYFHHCREVTIEISETKILATNQLNNYWGYNYRSLLNYIKQATYGIQGIVSDDCTGQGIVAEISVNSHDIDNSQVHSFLPSGKYYRPIYQGTWDVTYSSPGYQPVVIQDINVNNYSSFQQNVTLQQIQPVADFYADSVENCTGLISFSNTSIAPLNGTIYEWNFGDGDTSGIKNPVHKFNSNGLFTVQLIVTTSCGYKDTISKYNYININMPPSPAIINAESCGPATSLTISATGSGTINWYYNADDTVSFYSGNSVVLSNVDTTVTYYVEDLIEPASVYGGKPDNSGNGLYYTSFGQDYLAFNCFKEIELVSVKVYAGSTGTRSIYLLDASNNVLDYKDINIPQGASRITLNFKLPVANNLKLAGSPGADLYINSSGVSYPYTSAGLFSITNGSDMFNPTKYYYFFYDWEVKEPSCISPRLPVSAYINDSAPVAGFNYSEFDFDVQFTDNSTGANSWYWNFGDGNTSTDQNPVHQYDAPASYIVILKVHNACGEDSIQQNITVTGINKAQDNSGILIFPNPAKDYIYVLNASKSEKTDQFFCIYDIAGRMLKQGKINYHVNNEKFIIDLTDFTPGIYILQISDKDYFASQRVIITR